MAQRCGIIGLTAFQHGFRFYILTVLNHAYIVSVMMTKRASGLPNYDTGIVDELQMYPVTLSLNYMP